MSRISEYFVFTFIAQTEKAILVKKESSEEQVWLPKSVLDFDILEMDTIQKGEEIEIGMPEWLAEEKGLT